MYPHRRTDDQKNDAVRSKFSLIRSWFLHLYYLLYTLIDFTYSIGVNLGKDGGERRAIAIQPEIEHRPTLVFLTFQNYV